MQNGHFEAVARARVSEIAKAYGLSDDCAFLAWVATLLWGLDEEDAVEHITDRPNDKRVDFFWYDDGAERIIVAQGKYTANPKLKDLNAFPSCLGWLAKPADLLREGLGDLADAARQFVELRDRDVPVELWFIHFGRSSASLDREAEVFNSTERNRLDRTQLRVASRQLLERILADVEDIQARVPHDELAVTWAQKQEGPYGKAMVATVKGSELARLYDTHGDRLFARNVRLFLGERRGSVNRGVLETLSDPDDRANFWAYNNGVTIVCQAHKYRPRKRLVELRSFSVVNGCQTTVCLHRSAGSMTDQVDVLVKMVSPTNEVIDRIIEFTNSQSPIRSWDIKSQDKVQRRLRDGLAALPSPYFYAIRKGEYETLPPARKKKFRDRGQKRVIQLDSVAQYLGAFRGRAYFAYKFKTRLFEDLYRDVFPEDIDANVLLFVWQVGEVVRGLVRQKLAHAVDEGDFGKVRILRKGCRMYLIAVVESLLRLRNGDTYLSRVADGRTLGSNRLQKIEKYCEWALDWYEEAVGRFLEDGKTDLGTLVRQEDFIERVLSQVRREYERMQRAKKYFEEAIPKLV
jgi:hypothetical protein